MAESEREEKKKTKKLKLKKPEKLLNRGTMYIGRLPHGFYEEQLLKFFSQFGKVTRLRVMRSKKTGGSKGYGFIEFGCDEVAKIAAETMNNFLIYGRILKCFYIPPEDVPPKLFSNLNVPFILNYVKNRYKHNAIKDSSQIERRQEIIKGKLQKKLEKLSELGINYNLQIGVHKSVKEATKQKKLQKRAKKEKKHVQTVT